MGDVQSRKWLVTINNPIDKGYTHEAIKNILGKLKSVVYWCMSDEIGLMGQTPHTHIFIACSSAVRFSTLHKRFEGAHFDVAKGTCQQNKEYVYKIGKWADTEKEDTSVKGTQEEYGEMPVERQGKRNDIDDLYDMIKKGMTDYEILESSPQYITMIDKIERVRQSVMEEKYKDVWREMDITYIYGETGTGKTRYVMEKYGYSKVYRVTDYKHPFDGYKGQDVICFDEFRSSLPLGRMLDYMQGYPVELRCRYANKTACFTKVYIISNIPLSSQYMDTQRYEIESWNAFVRRINTIRIYKGGKISECTCEEYLNGFMPCTERTPFDKEKLDAMEKKIYEQLSLEDRK